MSSTAQSLLQSILNSLMSIVSPILDFFSAADYYSFPENPLIANRYDFMIGGYTYMIDIQTGFIRWWNNQTGPFNIGNQTGSLQINIPANIQKRIKSALIFVSDADTAVTVNSHASFQDHKLYHVFNNLDTQYPILVQPPSNKVPNSIDLNFFLSTKAINPYAVDLQLTHTKKIGGPVTTTGGAPTWTDIIRLHIGGYDNLTAILQETGGANAAAWQVLVSEDDVNYFVIQGVTFTNIAASGYQTFTTNIKWHFYRIQVADAVGGNHATVKAYVSPIR